MDKLRRRRVREGFFDRLCPAELAGLSVGDPADPVQPTFRALAAGDPALAGLPAGVFWTVHAVLDAPDAAALAALYRLLRPAGHLIVCGRPGDADALSAALAAACPGSLSLGCRVLADADVCEVVVRRPSAAPADARLADEARRAAEHAEAVPDELLTRLSEATPPASAAVVYAAVAAVRPQSVLLLGGPAGLAVAALAARPYASAVVVVPADTPRADWAAAALPSRFPAARIRWLTAADAVVADGLLAADRFDLVVAAAADDLFEADARVRLGLARVRPTGRLLVVDYLTSAAMRVPAADAVVADRRLAAATVGDALLVGVP